MSFVSKLSRSDLKITIDTQLFNHLIPRFIPPVVRYPSFPPDTFDMLLNGFEIVFELINRWLPRVLSLDMYQTLRKSRLRTILIVFCQRDGSFPTQNKVGSVVRSLTAVEVTRRGRDEGKSWLSDAVRLVGQRNGDTRKCSVRVVGVAF